MARVEAEKVFLLLAMSLESPVARLLPLFLALLVLFKLTSLICKHNLKHRLLLLPFDASIFRLHL